MYGRSARPRLPAGRLRILDVGDPFGTISSLFPDDHTVSLDVYTDRPAVDEGHQHVVGSGFELPFADGTSTSCAATTRWSTCRPSAASSS